MLYNCTHIVPFLIPKPFSPVKCYGIVRIVRMVNRTFFCPVPSTEYARTKKHRYIRKRTHDCVDLFLFIVDIAYKAATRAIAPSARPKPAVRRPLPLTVTMPEAEGRGVKLPVPTGVVTRLLLGGAVVARAVVTAGTRATELAVPVPVVKATLGTVMAVLMMMVELELGMTEPSELVQGTTVVVSTVTVV